MAALVPPPHQTAAQPRSTSPAGVLTSKSQQTWTKIMVKRRRKTLIVCADCHHQIHSGNSAALTQ
ncbi:hypothetical protein [Micromonospora sp. NPDC050495]|uniref:HNH endonuclease n=1 Tax=Micromonospora sp. NPDC050495 TaxID=3154936 RepID=UPI00340E0AD3